MKNELEKKLVEKYPNLFEHYRGDPRQTCMAWGMSHGDGWYKLLEEACEKIKNTGTVFSQIKEKFGMLTIYYNCPNEEDELVSKAIHHAETRSLEVCELCGEKAKRRSDGGWVITLCKTCHAAREVERADRS